MKYPELVTITAFILALGSCSKRSEEAMIPAPPIIHIQPGKFCLHYKKKDIVDPIAIDLAIKECGYEAIMVNCNPETVSTDFDIADKLYFEPVFWEHLWEIVELEQPEGVIVQLGGQTALKLAKKLHERGIRIIGTSYDNMDIAEDRGRFSDRLRDLSIPYPAYGKTHPDRS